MSHCFLHLQFLPNNLPYKRSIVCLTIYDLHGENRKNEYIPRMIYISPIKESSSGQKCK